MPTIKGWPTQRKLCDRAEQEHTTVEPVRLQQDALSVLAHQFVKVITEGDIVEAGSTVAVINATGHDAQRGDIISFTSGVHNCREVKVDGVETDTIVMSENLSVAPTAGDTFNILRHKYPTVDATGAVITAPKTSLGAPYYDEFVGSTTPGSQIILITIPLAGGGLTRKIKKVYATCRRPGILKVLDGATQIASFRLGAGNLNNNFVWESPRPLSAATTVEFDAATGPVSDLEAYVEAMDI